MFTKVAGKSRYRTAAGTRSDGEMVSDVGQSKYKPGAVRLQLSRDAVESIESNVKRYKEFLQSRSYHTDSQFNPWTAVEQ